MSSNTDSPGTAAPITPGTEVVLTDAEGREHRAVALSGVEPGRTFPVVWVDLGRPWPTSRGLPWPADALRRLNDMEATS